VLLEVLAHVPTEFFHCLHCERVFDVTDVGAEVRREARASYPSQILEEAQRLSTLLTELSAKWGKLLQIRVIDPQSPEGLYKSLRHWIRRYPTFVIDRRAVYTGWDREALEQLLAGFDGRFDLA
jgi:hypothetical protein